MLLLAPGMHAWVTAFSVSLCLLYLETQDKHKHKGARWLRTCRKAVWGRCGGSMQAAGKLWCSRGLFITGWFGTMGRLLSDSMGIVWPGNCKAFLWISVVLSEK